MWRSLRLVLSEKAFCERLSSLSAVSDYLAMSAIRPRHGLSGLINTERPDAVIAQCGIFDRPALLSHAGAAKSSIGGEEMVVRLALPHVLCRRLVPFPVRVRL